MSGRKSIKTCLCAAAALTAMQVVGGGGGARADVLLSDFESGADFDGWQDYNGNITGFSLNLNPTGGNGVWWGIEFNNVENPTWTNAGPTIQPWANSNFTNAAFQANNFLQFDVIFPSVGAAGANGFIANQQLPMGINSNGGGANGMFDLAPVMVDTSIKDSIQHVVINYGPHKSSNPPGVLNISDWMNLLFGMPDVAQWGANPFTPKVLVDMVALTATSSPVSQPPAPGDGTWDANVSGSWGVASNWVGGVAASSINNGATFGSATGPRTVHLNTPINIGSINIDSVNGYNFTAGFQIQLGGAAPTVTVSSGSHTFAVIGVSSNATFNVAASSSLTINSFTTGGFGTVFKSGSGAMTVDQMNFVSLTADGSFSFSNPTPDAFLFGITALSPTAFIDLGSSNWRSNSLNGTGTIRIGAGGVLATALFDPFTFEGSVVGGGSLIFGGGGASEDNVGTFTGNNTYTGGTLVRQGTLIANKLSNGPLTIQDPALTTGATISKAQISLKGVANDPSGTTKVPSLTISGTGQLDLTNNSMIIDYTGAVGTLVEDTRAKLVDGRLISSAADATRKLGYGDNGVLNKSSFGGETVDASSLLIKFTYIGDVNLDGQVDITDLGALATAWQTNGPWTSGDFDYNGFVDITDLGGLATNWQAGVGSPLGPSLNDALASVGLGGASVPEPAAATLVGMCVAGVLARRRR